MLMIVLIFVTCALLYWMRRNENKNEPPIFPGRLPLIGHSHRLIGNSESVLNYFKDLSNESLKAGGVIYTTIGPKIVYVVTDPEDCMTIANTCLQKDKFYDFAKQWLGQGLVTADLPEWKVNRKLLNSAFNSTILDGLLSVFNRQSRRLVYELGAKVGKGPFDHWEFVRSNSLETICLTAFGVDFTDRTAINSQYLRTAEEMIRSYVDRLQKIWLYSNTIYNFSTLKKKQEEYLRILRNMSNEVLNTRKAYYLRNRQSEMLQDKTKGSKFKPFMDLLLEQAIEKGSFNDQEIIEHIDTVIVTGFDTTANLLLYTMLVIASYPNVQEKLVEELNIVFGEEDREVTKQDLSQLVYLEAVVKETLRVYPTVPVVIRYLDRDVKLRYYTLSKGRSCGIFIYGLHRHPMWGPNAEQFNPERWLNRASLPHNSNAFAAFSLGRRNCIGKSFAYMLLKTSIVHICRNYKLSGDIKNFKEKFEITLKAVSGHYISIERRK